MFCEFDNFIKCCKLNLIFVCGINIFCYKLVFLWYNVYILKFIFKGFVIKIIFKNKLIIGLLWIKVVIDYRWLIVSVLL